MSELIVRPAQVVTDPLDAPLSSYLKVFMQKKLAFKSPSCIYQYELNILKRFDEFLKRTPTLRDLRDETVQNFMRWIVKKKGLAPSSANKARDNFNCFWSFLARQGVVATYPEVMPMPEPEIIPVAWTQDDLSLLWEALSKQRGDFAGVPRNLWWLSLHAVLWDTASRIGAIRWTKWSDLEFGTERSFLTITPSKMKGGRRGQVYRLHPDTVALLLKMQAPIREYVWPFPFASPFYVYAFYREILHGCGLPSTRERMFHCMRKSSISWVQAAGGDATKLAGHCSPEITQRHYVDARIAGAIDTTSILFRPDATPAKPDAPAPAAPVPETVLTPAPVPATSEEVEVDEFAFL